MHATRRNDVCIMLCQRFARITHIHYTRSNVESLFARAHFQRTHAHSLPYGTQHIPPLCHHQRVLAARALAKEVLSLWSLTHRSCTTRVGKLAIALQSQNVLFSSASEVLAVRRDVRLVTFVTTIIVCRGAVVPLQRRHDAHHLGRMSLFRNIPQWPSSASSSSAETYTTNTTPPPPSSSSSASVHHATINSARSQRTCCWRRGSLRRRRCTVPQLLAGGFRVTQHTKRRLRQRERECRVCVRCFVASMRSTNTWSFL